MLNTYESDIEKNSFKQGPAPIMTPMICQRFLELIALPEEENCDSCNYAQNRSACLKHDCLSKIQVCEDLTCRKNLFWEKLKIKRRDTPLSKIMRNCEFGLRFISFQITLSEIGALYGMSRERIRQIEERAIARAARIIRNNRDYYHILIQYGSIEALEKRIAKYHLRSLAKRESDNLSHRRRRRLGYHN